METAVGDAVDEVKAFEGDDPVSSLVHALGDGPENGAEVVGGDADPLADAVDVAAVEEEVVVGCGADDGGLDVGVAEGGAGGEVGLPDAVLVLQNAGGHLP